MPSVSLQTILQNNLPRGYTGSRGEPGAGYTGSKGSGLDDWIKISSNYTATSGNRLIADTSLASFTVTLPTSPQLGDHVVLTDGGDWSGYPLIIDSGAKQVEGYDEGVILDVGGVTTELLYDGTMWHVTATLGAEGAEGPPGLGVPEGGTQGQILTKMSSTEYDTAWQDPAGGDLGSIEIVGSTIATTDSTDISIDRNLRVHGDLTPELDSVFDLGSADKKWRSLYVSGQSIYINNTAISVDESGNLLVGGQIPEGSVTSLENIGNVDISNLSAGQILGYTGSNWTNQTVETGGGGADSYVKTYFWEGALQENVSRKRFYIHVNSTLETITINLGTFALTETTIAVKRNGTILNSINVPANTTYVTTSVNHSMVVNDFITVDITKSSSAENLYVTLVYREQ